MEAFRENVWTPQSEINNGKIFVKYDGISANDFNIIVENLIYLYGVLKQKNIV